jgi:hypothetical protein
LSCYYLDKEGTLARPEVVTDTERAVCLSVLEVR